jgi:uncharacterized protein (DUF1800 family)
MVAAWRQSDGDIAAVLRAMKGAPAYKASLGHAFKDPVHYVVSAVRYAFGSGAGGNVVLNVDPMIRWLNRMGQGSMTDKRLMAIPCPHRLGPGRDRWRCVSKSPNPSAMVHRA